jgi:SAM-dependent methyltransferase
MSTSTPSDILKRMALPPLTEPFKNVVDSNFSGGDGMLATEPGHSEPNYGHYFSVGASALNTLLATISVAQTIPKTILDFGCGGGSVTRWLRAAFPTADLSACDLDEKNLAFVREHFNAYTWSSATDIASLQAPTLFDLIWLGSVVTHLDERTSIMLLRKLFSWLTPKGLLVVSLHGRTARRRGDTGVVRYLQPEGWQQVRAGCDATGYGYADYAGQHGYGISVVSPHWAIERASQIENARIVLFGEALWDNHHDVLALQRS